MQLPTLNDVRIGIIGLGYVGLPLAVYMAREYPVVGFDIDAERIEELRRQHDRTREVTDEEFALAKHVSYSASPADLADCNFFIVTVPTPIDAARQPDLSALRAASKTVGSVIRPGSVVVYESTVYPGATEEVCIPIIEEVSGLTFNKDFVAGYSPERINPGDMEHRLPSITKITSGSTPDAAELIDAVYARIITAGTHRASSIRVAEAAKIVENIQRDVNIALVNELAMLFKKLGVETREVLDAAGTKWNFHGYRPGLVGGHCIGVDPYYLTHKARMIGFHPEVILSGRRTNDGMAQFVAHDIISQMIKRKIPVAGARTLILGFAFKENCPDIRNTKVVDLVTALQTFVPDVVVYDPEANPAEAKAEYGTEITNQMPEGPFDAIILAVRHRAFVEMGAERIRALLRPQAGLFYDIKEAFPIDTTDARI